MPRSLWLLLGLQCKGWFRSFGRSLKTVKGALLVIVGLILICAWILPTLFVDASQAGASAENVRRFAPIGLLAYCLLSVLLSKGERAVYFTPAEVNFLFAGPYTRRQLLIFKITTSGLICLLTALFLSAAFRIHARWFLAAYLAWVAGLLFMQLFALLLSFIALSIGARAYSAGRKLILAGLIVLAVVLLWRAGLLDGATARAGLFEKMEASSIWRALALPFRPFVEAFLTPRGDWAHLGLHLGLAFLINGAMLLAVILMDAQYLESAAATSEKVYAQIQKIRRGDGFSASWGKGGGKARWSLPTFPAWGGIGPNLWRQMMTAFRNLGRLSLIGLALLPVVVLPMISADRHGDQAGVYGGMIGLVWMTILLSNMLPFDFRGDLDRMEVLKTLPIPAWRLVVAQLLAPVLIISFIHGLLLLGFQVMQQRFDPWLSGGLLVIVPFNFLMIAMDNLFFLWFPSRIMAANPADFQALGRNVLFFLLKMMVLGSVALVTGLLSYLIYLVSGRSILATLGAASLLLSLAGIGLVPVLVLAFRRFDVSRDIPA